MIALFMFLIIYMILAAVVGTIALTLLFYGGIGFVILSLFQFILGIIIKTATGKKPNWLFSKESFYVEITIIAIFLIAYANVPLHPAKIDPEICAMVYTSEYKEPGVDEPFLSHQENIHHLAEVLADIRVSHTFLYSKEVLDDSESHAGELYFYDSEGNFIEKVCYVDNLLGVSHKKDGKYTFYDCSESVYQQIYPVLAEISDVERTLKREEANQGAFEALCASFRYADGVYTFIVPEFVAESWKLEICACERRFTKTIMGDNGYVVKTGDETQMVYFLTEHTEAGDWLIGEQYSFALDEEKTYDGVYCKVTIDNSKFDFDFPDPDEKYRADRDNPVIYHMYPN